MSDGALVTPANRRLRVGTHLITGRAKGTYVQVVQPDAVAAIVGVDAEGYFNDNGDESAVLTVALLPSSISNDFLAAFRRARLPIPVILTEVDGRTVGQTARAMVVKMPDVTWSDGSDVRMWALVATVWRSYPGGMGPAAITTAVPDGV